MDEKKRKVHVGGHTKHYQEEITLENVGLLDICPN